MEQSVFFIIVTEVSGGRHSRVTWVSVKGIG